MTEAEALLARCLDGLPLKAGGFIVTLYGDAIEPRGGSVWMGNIIEICAAMGLSETLVRTAVSRLVAAGRLAGTKQGRRSFYRLTDEARTEFLDAARLLFEPSAPAGWRFVWAPAAETARIGPALEACGHARLGGAWFFGPSSGVALPHGAVAFAAEALGPLPVELAASHWDLAGLGAAYEAFLERFSPLRCALDAGLALTDSQALQARLALVHAYRAAALRDPHLPEAALPADWSGGRARQLFAGLYLSLSPGADRRAGLLVSETGPLPADTPALVRRRTGIDRLAAPG